MTFLEWAKKAYQTAVGWLKRKFGRVEFKVVVAMDSKAGIGLGNGLPWAHFTEDMEHFKYLTLKDRVVLMGQRTADSIPVGLPGRTCIIVSSKGVGHNVASNLEQGLNLAAYHAKTGVVWIIGGARLWEQCFTQGVVSEVWVTRILDTFDADTSFPWTAMCGRNWTIADSEIMAYRDDRPYAHLTTYRRE